jgi:hypothetical protein
MTLFSVKNNSQTKNYQTIILKFKKMKAKYFLISIALSSLIIDVPAQLPKSVSKKISTISPGSSFNWYKNFLTSKFSKLTNTGEQVLNQRIEGNLKVQVGINQQPSANEYVNNGSATSQSDGNISCTYQPKLINYLVPGDFSVSHLNSFTNYPGDFINPNSIINGIGALTTYTPPAPHLRRPYKIGLSIFTPKGNNEITVTDFTSSPQAKIQDSLLISNFGAGIPVNGVIKVTELKSELQYKASFEASAGIFLPLEELDIPLDVTAGLRASGSNQTNVNLRYFAVDFFQPLYTLSLLTYNSSLFINAAHTAQNANGAYISDVTYGRRASFIFSSTNYSAVLNAFFEGGADIALTGGDFTGTELGVKEEGQVNTSVSASIQNFWGKIYGGSSAGSLAAYSNISAFHTAFKNYITSSTARKFSASTGALPLFYSLHRISDGAIIGVRSVGPFDEKVSCNTNSYTVDLNFKGFKVNKVDEGLLLTDHEDDIYGSFGYKNRNTNTAISEEGKYQLFNKDKDHAISKGEGEEYLPGDAPHRIIQSINKTDLKNTILNFDEDIKDWELAITPKYDPQSGNDMQFKFSSNSSQIDGLEPGQYITFTKSISLYENGNNDKAKVTFKVEIKVTRN